MYFLCPRSPWVKMRCLSWGWMGNSNMGSRSGGKCWKTTVEIPMVQTLFYYDCQVTRAWEIVGSGVKRAGNQETRTAKANNWKWGLEIPSWSLQNGGCGFLSEISISGDFFSQLRPYDSCFSPGPFTKIFRLR